MKGIMLKGEKIVYRGWICVGHKSLLRILSLPSKKTDSFMSNRKTLHPSEKHSGSYLAWVVSLP
jgi:hypothetical protein